MSSFSLTGTLFFDWSLDRKTIEERHQNFLKEFSELSKGEFSGYLDSANPEGSVYGVTDCAPGVDPMDMLQELCEKFNCVGVFRISDENSDEPYFVGCGQEEKVRNHLNEVVAQYYLRKIVSEGDFPSVEEYRNFLVKSASQFI